MNENDLPFGDWYASPQEKYLTERIDERMTTFTVNSFFAGIGGFDLAFQAAGFKINAQVEIDDFCTTILQRHWPEVPKFRDIKETGAHNLPYADVVCGGFPCQDISLAGKRAGIRDGTRSGLWFEFSRVIGELRPQIVLLENVAAITTAGGGGSTVIADLAKMGYDARWGIIRASDAGAPHQRARWFCVAYGESARNTFMGNAPQFKRFHIRGKRGKLQPQKYQGQQRSQNTSNASWSNTNGRQAQSRLGRTIDGVPYRLDAPRWPAPPGPQYDWEPPRTTTQREYRSARLKALGNAVVPAVVYPVAVMIRKWLEVNA